MANQNSSNQGNKNSSGGGSSKKSIHDTRPTQTHDINQSTTKKS